MTASLLDLSIALPPRSEQRARAFATVPTQGVSFGLVLRGCHCLVCGAEAIREGRAGALAAETTNTARCPWYMACASCGEVFLTEEMQLFAHFVEWTTTGDGPYGLPGSIRRAFEELEAMDDPYPVLRRRLAQREPSFAGSAPPPEPPL